MIQKVNNLAKKTTLAKFVLSSKFNIHFIKGIFGQDEKDILLKVHHYNLWTCLYYESS